MMEEATIDLLQEDGLLHIACGTPNYFAPEVLSDKGYDGIIANVWSCGVILFVLMASYLSFDDFKSSTLSICTIKLKIQNANFVLPPWLSYGAMNFMKHIVDPNPLTSITISEILQEQWLKKDYHSPSFVEEGYVNLDDVRCCF